MRFGEQIAEKVLDFCCTRDYAFSLSLWSWRVGLLVAEEELLMLSCDFRRIVAVALVFTTTFITIPLSAADFSATRPVIGSVSAVGVVELRGIGISQEGTLFAGDSIRAHEKGYAKILLRTGSKIELNEKTDINISGDVQGMKIAMNSGLVGFTAHTPLRIDVLPFEVTASDDASGNVAIMSSTSAGVRAISGKVMVRNLKTSESFVLIKGQERLLGLHDGVHAPSLAELASNVPGPLPAPVPQTPAGKTTGGLAMDTGAWLAVIGGAAVAGLAIWGLLIALDNRDDNKKLSAKIDNLTNTINSGGGNSAALKNISNASNIASAVAQEQAQLALIASLAGQAQLALGGSAAANTASSISGQAVASQNRLNALASAISALEARLASGSGSAADVQALLQQEEVQRANANTLANQLNALLAANINVNGVPRSTVGLVGPPVIASASVPV